LPASAPAVFQDFRLAVPATGPRERDFGRTAEFSVAAGRDSILEAEWFGEWFAWFVRDYFAAAERDSAPRRRSPAPRPVAVMVCTTRIPQRRARSARLPKGVAAVGGVNTLEPDSNAKRPPAHRSRGRMKHDTPPEPLQDRKSASVPFCERRGKGFGGSEKLNVV
jgi:hypothetical protein